MQLFLIALFATFLATRVVVLLMPTHTLTGYLRRRTTLYIHHIYLGVLMLALALPLILAHGPAAPFVLLAGAGVALTLDELPAWLLYAPYPSRREFGLTLLLFLLVGLYAASLGL